MPRIISNKRERKQTTHYQHSFPHDLSTKLTTKRVQKAVKGDSPSAEKKINITSNKMTLTEVLHRLLRSPLTSVHCVSSTEVRRGFREQGNGYELNTFDHKYHCHALTNCLQKSYI